jgi:RNA polymerase sigma-70 factor (ECF subfamily)
MAQTGGAASLRHTEFVAEEEVLNSSENNLSETDLVRRCVDGDELAFGEIVRRFSPRVFRVCGRFFKRFSLVEEAAQETFLRAYTQLGKFEGRGSLEGWITRIASTTCINILRAQKRQSELLISELSDQESSWLEDFVLSKGGRNSSSNEDRLIASDLVEKIFATLPADDVTVLIMTEVYGSSLRETAELTGWTESKVKVKAFRARKKMREALEKLSDGFVRKEKSYD